MTTPDALRHNHPAEPFHPLRAPGQCPRCDQRRAQRTAEGLTDHVHEPLPFGRLKPYGTCPRCDELHDGAQPRRGHYRRAAHEGQQLTSRMNKHFGPGGPHERGECGPVCTAFDW